MRRGSEDVDGVRVHQAAKPVRQALQLQDRVRRGREHHAAAAADAQLRNPPVHSSWDTNEQAARGPRGKNLFGQRSNRISSLPPVI